MSVDDAGRHLPCGLALTSHMYRTPPLISRVCCETRAVALQKRSLLSKERVPGDAKWRPDTQLNSPIDPSRNLVYLNWLPGSPFYPTWLRASSNLVYPVFGWPIPTL